jgi:curved DNA-binding protein CbpA
MRRFSDRNYYAVLGVVSSASRDEIKAAYRTLVRTAHPDRGGSADHFALIAEAWEILGDPAQRSNYDAERRMQLRANRPYTTRLPDDRVDAPAAPRALFRRGPDRSRALAPEQASVLTGERRRDQSR